MPNATIPHTKKKSWKSKAHGFTVLLLALSRQQQLLKRRRDLNLVLA